MTVVDPCSIKNINLVCMETEHVAFLSEPAGRMAIAQVVSFSL